MLSDMTCWDPLNLKVHSFLRRGNMKRHVEISITLVLCIYLAYMSNVFINFLYFVYSQTPSHKVLTEGVHNILTYFYRIFHNIFLAQNLMNLDMCDNCVFLIFNTPSQT